MNKQKIAELRAGLETGFINSGYNSSLAYQPQFLSNNHKEGKKVLSSIEDELMACDKFQISVAFITMGGITPLLQTLKELEKNGIPGEILTTNYLNFSEPKALEKLHGLSNITLKMYDVEKAAEGFHTKGYIFKKEEIYRIIIGSSNMTSAALTSNREWNTKVVSTEQGEVAKQIVEEYNELWNSRYALSFDNFYEEYKERYQIIKRQREIAKSEETPSIEKYRLKPNAMQVGFITNLRKILEKGEDRALLISATGTGKTYASAFAMRELGFKRVLFLVHRGQLARQTKKSYEKIFDKSVSMGLVGAGYSDYDRDYVFATVQTLNRDEHLRKYAPDDFDCIILDEAHHSSANTYQKVMNYFTPKLWLGMTATPDKRDDDIDGKNIYQIFNYQIAYEIRLQQAMEENMLCPFHYFGITDVSLLGDKEIKSKKLTESSFNQLVGDERVKHIIEQANYFGHSGDRVKGLIFCSRIDESVELSNKFNQTINPETGRFFRTIALNGDATEEERQRAFERLAMDENTLDTTNKTNVGQIFDTEGTEKIDKADGKMQPLDYIFSVEILNEGVDIVEVNQVIMLRPTESLIVFIQQLGRGLRKANGKEYVVILDFIGNYNNNFMIPVALSGDPFLQCRYNQKCMLSRKIIRFPELRQCILMRLQRIGFFASIDKIKGMRSIIRESYVSLKNRLGRVPYLLDFYENGEVDPLVIIKEYKTYQAFLEAVEKELYTGRLNEQEKITLEYLSKTIISGARPFELEILRQLMKKPSISINEIREIFIRRYDYKVNMQSIDNAADVLQGKFVSKDDEYKRFCRIDILEEDSNNIFHRMNNFTTRLENEEFKKQIDDIIEVGLKRYHDKYQSSLKNESPFVLYEKYSRRDVSLLMNCGRDLSSTMYGMKRIDDDVFIFVTYHKEESTDEQKNYVDGKPDYADAFEDNMIFRWDSQIGRGVDSSYVSDVVNTKRKHLLVKKSDAESNFYYMGEFDIVDVRAARKRDNNGKERDITKFEMKMHHPVR